MEALEVQKAIQKHTSEIKEKVIPVVTEKIMFSFTEGFECGMDVGCSVIRDETIGWLYFQLSKGLIEVRDVKKLVSDYKDFIEVQIKRGRGVSV